MTIEDIPGWEPVWQALDTQPKYVASTTLADPAWSGTTVLSDDLATAIVDLKAKAGGELQVHGSGALTRWFLEDLVDEMTLIVVPVVLGQGARLFPDSGPDLALEMVSHGSTRGRDDPGLPARRAPGVRQARRGGGVMTTVEANGVTLGVEHFGDAAAPLVLLAGGTTMLSWPDALCEALARGGRHVVRYDLRDSGASTTVDPEAPAYTLRDLAADAAALARELDDRPAHLAGIGVGGMVAQVAALDHPDAFSALTLAGTRPVAPGRVDDDLPDHDAATMERLFSRSMPDWSDRAAVAEFAAARRGDPRRRPRRRARDRRAHLGPHAGHGARGADGQPAGHGVRQARLQAALARAPARARDPGAARRLGVRRLR